MMFNLVTKIKQMRPRNFFYGLRPVASGVQARYGLSHQTLPVPSRPRACAHGDFSDTNVLRIKTGLLLTLLLTLIFSTPALACTSPVGVAGDMVYNDTEHVMKWCDGTNWNGVGTPPYIPSGVEFDTNDYLSISSELSGVTTGTQGTMSFWARTNDIDSRQQVVGSETNSFFDILHEEAFNTLRVQFSDGIGANLLDLRTGPLQSQWKHYLISFDLTNTANRHVYINGAVASATWLNYVTTGTIDYVGSSGMLIGARSPILTSDRRLNGSIADFWIDFDTYLDLSDPNIRAKFIDANGFPVDLGSDGSRPTGSAPDIYLSGDTATWHTNDGTGGGFTENGALTDALTDPGENLGTTADLIAWWRLDETSGTTMFDSSGNGHDGTISSVMSLPADSRNGIISNGIYMDTSGSGGANRYRVESATGFPTGTNPPFSFSFWFNLLQIDQDGTLFNTGGNTGDELTFRTDGTGGAFRLSCTGGTNANIPFAGLASNLGNWALITMTYDGTDATFYSNGSLVSTFTFNCTTTRPIFALGSKYGGSSFAAKRGLYDDFRLYDRALSLPEIQELYDTGFPCKNPLGQRDGDMVYNTTHHIPQYCNLREWRAMGAQPGDGGSCPNIGDLCSDGSIFAGNGLYVTASNQSTGITWNPVTGNNDIDPDSLTSGLINRNNLTVPITTLPAINLCETLSLHGHDDWYLPAQDELNVLYINRSAINASASQNFTTGNYWSSSESTNNVALRQQFNTGVQLGSQKDNSSHNVRCVRRVGPSDCSNPTGQTGDISYNTTSNVMTYCEGDEWRAMAF